MSQELMPLVVAALCHAAYPDVHPDFTDAGWDRMAIAAIEVVQNHTGGIPMSKERAAHLKTLFDDGIDPLPPDPSKQEKARYDKQVAQAGALAWLATEFLGNIARIADALDAGNKQRPEITIDPELLARGVAALESLASQS